MNLDLKFHLLVSDQEMGPQFNLSLEIDRKSGGLNIGLLLIFRIRIVYW